MLSNIRKISLLGCLLLLTISLGVPSAWANKVLSLDGDGDYMEVIQDIPETNFTVELQFRTFYPSGGMFQVLGGGGDREIYFNNNGSLSQRIFEEEVITSTSSGFNNGLWHHYAMVVEQGIGQKMYVDGLLEALGSKDHSDFDWQNRFWAGFARSKSLYGQLDEVRVWNVARTQIEIQETMNQPIENPELLENLVGYWNFDTGTADDLSQYKNHGTLYGDAQIGEIIYVSPEGDDIDGKGTAENPYQTIQKAIRESRRHDIIQALPGTYEENISLLSDLILFGFGVENTTLLAASGNIVTANNVHNVTLSEFTIDGQGSADHGIVCSGTTSEMEIRNNVITGSSIAGIGCSGSASVIIEKNVVRKNTGNGIYCDASTKPIVVDNDIEYNSGHGIECAGNSNPLVTNNHIKHNQKSGIVCRHTVNVNVQYNIIDNNQTYDGVTLTDDSQSYFSHNTICRNKGMGFRIFANSITTISDNSIHSNSHAAIWCGNNSNVTIIRNTISNNIRAVATPGYAHLLLGGSLVNANNITNHPIAIENATANTINATYNYWGTTDESEIAAMMYNPSEGSVDFKPFINTLDEIIADVSGDGTISAYDAALILQYIVGIIDQFPATSPIGQAAQKYISGEITVDELDRILQKLGYPSVFKLLGIENQLLQNYPNPFNPETWIPFKLAQNASVTIKIYNTKGQHVRTISLGTKQAGVYVTKDKAAYWDGKNNAGEKVTSGIYWYTLCAGEFNATRRMVILK